MPPREMWDSIGFPSIVLRDGPDSPCALFMHPSGMSLEENPACKEGDESRGALLTRAMTALIMTPSGTDDHGTCMLAYHPNMEGRVVPHWLVFFHRHGKAPVSAKTFGVQKGGDTFRQLIEGFPLTNKSHAEIRFGNTPFALAGSCGTHQQKEPELYFPVAVYLPDGCFKREILENTPVVLHPITYARGPDDDGGGDKTR